jgi:hypothetical protein
VASIQEPLNDRRALTRWCREVDPVLDDLSACSVIAASMLIGSATSNMVIVEALDVLTRDADFWLLTHPCPEESLGQYLSAIVCVFTAYGQLVAGFDGDVQAADDGTLASQAESACNMVRDFRMMAKRSRLSRSRGRLHFIRQEWFPTR